MKIKRKMWYNIYRYLKAKVCKHLDPKTINK